MAVFYATPESVPAEAVETLKAAYVEAAGGDADAAFEIAVREILFLLPGVSNGMLRIRMETNVATNT
ncbi:hypothetical protein [Sinorhizobium fredii]|uniref:hypothetical protein n=1 Tax=Rhizobium fredii TaxID=380 RepID=UPI003512F9F2